MPTPVDWNACRAQFPVLKAWAYFAWASVAPLSVPAAEAMRRQAEATRDQGVAVFREWYAAYDGVREQSRALLGAADAGEIAMVKNTSEGVSTVAFGLDWKSGDNVVLPRGEFPANAYPWLALGERGVEVRRVETGADGRYAPADIERRMDARTRAVAVSFVNYATGFRTDLAEVGRLCLDRGALFFVDAIQGLGALPLDVESMRIDVLAADGHKWLCAPEGLGILYVRKSRQDRIAPLARGWWSVEQPARYDLDDQPLCRTARRYECGTLSTCAAYGLQAALELINAAGIEAIAERVLALSDRLAGGLAASGCKVHRAAGAKERSGIVSFEVPGCDAKTLAAALERRKILVNPRGGRLRAAVHAWNDETDIARLLEALQSEGKSA